MRVGVTFPQTELGGDADAVRAYAERVAGLATVDDHLSALSEVAASLPDPSTHARPGL